MRVTRILAALCAGSVLAASPSTANALRGRASGPVKRKQNADEFVGTGQQSKCTQEPRELPSVAVDNRNSLTTGATSAEGVVEEATTAVRNRVAAWTKCTTTAACSSVSSSSTGSLASAGADSESDGTSVPAPPPHQPEQTTRVEQLSSVVAAVRRLSVDKSDQPSKDRRLATALMRVEQGALSEKTRMLLAKISVARSNAANGSGHDTGHVANATNE